MPQTFNQNGHTLWSMCTLWSSWHFEKSLFSCSGLSCDYVCILCDAKSLCDALITPRHEIWLCGDNRQIFDDLT
jgi:hypothetical protein